MARCDDCAPPKHKGRVIKSPVLPLWYASCSCGWEPDDAYSNKGQDRYCGRDTQRQAFEVAFDHVRKENNTP